MNRFGIAVVAFIGIIFLLAAADTVRKAAQDPGGIRWWRVIGGLLVIYGGAAFFGQGLASVGGVRFLGPSFEWPVGVSHIVAADSQGRRVVAMSTCGRVQAYSADGRFLNGWFFA